jgi:hypothetical protein
MLTAQLTTIARPDQLRLGVLQLLARAKRSGGPEDRALYSCSCGHSFKAEVSTSVGCPSCGTGQAW